MALRLVVYNMNADVWDISYIYTSGRVLLFQKGQVGQNIKAALVSKPVRGGKYTQK